MTIYLFHNVYGDADDLIANKPSDCVTVPAGWDEAAEANRNQIIASLDGFKGFSCLPSVVYFQPAYQLTVTDTATQETKITDLGNSWTEIRVEDMPKPWNWVSILDVINADKNRTISFDSTI
jgi:hypothetical protein